MRQAISVGAIVLAALSVAAPGRAQSSASSSPALDFEFFRTRVQPIFTAKRTGHARCIACHSARNPQLQPLADGSTTWTEDQSRQNFEVFQRLVVPGNPLASRLLLHPLALEAGGDLYHSGGKHWTSRDNPEWQTIAAWVRGETATSSPAPAAAGTVRIVQTNSAGDNVHLIDPVTNRVVGEVTGIEVAHGVAAAPDGTRLYLSNEADHTLDVVDVQTLRVTRKIPLTGRPNNISIGRDGGRVYVGIAEAPGAVDVIDTRSLTNAKTIPVDGAVHNTYVTPDGRYVVAGSIAGRNMTVIDTDTEAVAWVLDFDLGVRPMAFERNADGSTRRAFAQLSNLNGFAVIDWAMRKEVARITLPELRPGKAPVRVGGNVSHGIGVTADNTTLIVNSRLNSAVYSYALPDLTLTGTVEIDGIDPNWVTLTPDSKTAYIAIAGSNFVSAIDIDSMTQVARIPVGQVPKRNVTAVLP